ncbi:MAG: HAD-IC family P-type ATPase, partial [Patescibacteria group bacterium]
MNSWHSMRIEGIVKTLKTNPELGISDEKASKIRESSGYNTLPEKKGITSLTIFLNQFKSPLVYVLLIVGVVVYFLEQHPQNLFQSGFVLASVVINSVFGFLEEKKVSKVLEKLTHILKAKAVVIREGIKKEINRKDIVPGDIIVLEPGEKVPADARLISTNELKVSEAVLTGEWLPADKKTKVLEETTPLADRDNMVYSGTIVESGSGLAIVVAIGQETEVGKIAKLLTETKEEKTPLQKKLERFTSVIAKIILASTLVIFGLGILRGDPPIEMFETAVAISVSGIPESLPIVMTIILVIGMERLAKKKGLVRRLSSVETLGSTQVICCDKTRTITEGEMEADKVITVENTFDIKPGVKDTTYEMSLKIAAMCNDAFVENPKDSYDKWRVGGTPTGKALLMAGAKAGFLKPEYEKSHPTVKFLAFNSVIKYQASIHKIDHRYMLFVCGAPDILLKVSKYVQLNYGKRELNEVRLEEIERILNRLALKGSRLICTAYKEIQKPEEDINLEEEIKDLTFTGLISMNDPIRVGVKTALETCQEAGMKVVIITGDHRNTAKAIANKLGLSVDDENILEGTDLEAMSVEELSEIVEKIVIYARTEPKHKSKIVEAWQKIGKVVAMTGDGINDAPALKKADIGIALGSGTDVAKEVSDLVLLNDSFSIIVDAVEEGRVILDNLRKGISYILSDAFSSTVVVGFSMLMGWPIPLFWTQILWNNIVEDTLPNIAFAFEPKEKDVMKRKPYPA